MPCNKTDGTCPGECADGWITPRCNETCTFGRYGEGCKGICGHCESNKTCNYVNGSCSGLCEPGYHGENCLTKYKDGWFGKECNGVCGYCRGNKPCHHVTGSCSGLCEPGFHGENCENGVSYQILAGVRELLNLMTELISHRRRKSDLKEKGTSPTDFE
ncbi:protein draper-like [Saccostrea cucullata]|uniref:protein draper-like n=1 Tax=Saccostrea cuccullata TaxID=36930 RepID=UPI002ED17A51